MNNSSKTCWLIGGGHAHAVLLHLLGSKAALLASRSGLQFKMVAKESLVPYSGLLPECLSAKVNFRDSLINIEQLANQAGCEFHCAEATVDLATKQINFLGECHHADFISLNLGYRSLRLEELAIKSCDQDTLVVALKPLQGLLAKLPEIKERSGKSRVCIIGAGAAGVELAFAVRAFASEVVLVEQAATILPGFSAQVQAKMKALLIERGIEVITNAQVESLASGQLAIANLAKLKVSVVILAAGGFVSTEQIKVDAHSVDSHGALWVDQNLQSFNYPGIFATGDAAAMSKSSKDKIRMLPAAGVISIRQAPILLHNLIAAANDSKWKQFRPRRSYLTIFNTGDGKALASLYNINVYARLSMHWKNYLDWSFLQMLKGLKRPSR